jgi:hypothetical protein
MRKNSVSRKKHFKSFLPLRNILKIKKTPRKGTNPLPVQQKSLMLELSGMQVTDCTKAHYPMLISISCKNNIEAHNEANSFKDLS